MILSMKLSRCFTLRGKHDFQVSTRKSSKSATSAVELGFSLAGFRFIFFRKNFLNAFSHKLTSEAFMVGFCCKPFSWKTEESILTSPLPSTLWNLKLSNANQKSVC